MHFMERRGSGFKKIKADYRHAVNYQQEYEPVFRSTPTSFFVTLYNLNYHVPIEKVSVGNEKLAFETEKLAFEHTISEIDASAPTKQKISTLFNEFGFETIFSRADVISQFSIPAATAGYLLTKMKEFNLVEPVSDMGKGKYTFKKQ